MHNGQKSQCQRRRRVKIRGFWGLLLASAGMLIVDSAQWLHAPTPGWITYTSPIGKMREFGLQDGSTLDLNTNSEIRVLITGKKRQFVLVRGEALFNVARRPDWPFELTAGTATIRSVSAKLSVRLRESDETDVLVIDGSADVAPDGGAGISPVDQTHLVSAAPLNMSVGDWLSMNPTAVLRRMTLNSGLMAHKTAWTDGWLWFIKEPLPEVVAEFNRYHREQLVLMDPSLATLEIGGRFRSSDLESFLATLEHSFNVQRASSPVLQTDVDTIYLTRRCRGAQQHCNWPLVQ
jgi:transmembrane sensor